MTGEDEVKSVPSQFELLASTKGCRVAVMKHKTIYGVQFHPEQSSIGKFIFGLLEG